MNVYSKIDELRQIESIFPQNQVNDLIGLKESINHKIISKLNELDYKLKKKNKKLISVKFNCLLYFKKHTHRSYIDRRC